MIKESYISMWNKLPTDAIKVRVARPSVLSASKELVIRLQEREDQTGASLK